MESPWIVKDLNLNFRLGVRHLYKHKLKALTFENQLTYNPEILSTLEIPKTKFTEDITVVYIQSIPIEHRNIRLNINEPTIRYTFGTYIRHYIDLSLDYSSYLSILTPETRRNLKRKVKKFTEYSNGEINWKEYRGRDVAEFYSLAREISKKTYQEKLLDEGLPADNEFTREMMELATIDSVRGYMLFHEKRPIAYWYHQIVSNALCSQYCGYDPEYSHCSPGIVLNSLIIKKLFEDRSFKILDQGAGDFYYKKALATNSMKNIDILFFRKTLTNSSLIKAHSIWESTTGIGYKIADKLNLRPILKKMNKML